MNRSRVVSLVSASLVLAGCVTQTAGKPFLTQRAFRRAAATCHVIPQGVHHSRGSKVPFANFRLADSVPYTGDDDGYTCLHNALTGYRYDFLGEETTPERE